MANDKDLIVNAKIENIKNVTASANIQDKKIIRTSVDVSTAGGGTKRHDLLLNRDLPDQHPISAITELDNELNKLATADSDNYNTLNTKIDDTKADLQQDLTSLSSTVQSNYTTLNNKIDTVNQELTSDIDNLAEDVAKDVLQLQQNINTEATTRAESDTLLQNNINTLTNTVSDNYDTLSGLITNEISNRTQADANLITEINKKADKSEIPTIPQNVSAFNNDVGYLTEHQSLSNYYNKSEVDAKVSSVYRVCGSVESFSKLPQNAVKGDVYNVLDSGANYVWTGSEWDKLSETIDLTPYLTKQEATNTYQPIINDLATIRSGASKGATALQSYTETDPIYSADKPNIALKSEIPSIPTNISYFNNDSGYINSIPDDYIKNTDYASASNTGVIKAYSGYSTAVDDRNGVLYCQTKSATAYDGLTANAFIGKGTLENIKENLVASVGDNKYSTLEQYNYLDEKVREIELFKFPNAVIIGEPNISNGQVSGFSTSNYMQFPFILDLHDQAFQIDFCFTTATNVTTQQNILDSNFGLALAIQNGKGVMAISSNGTSWNIGSAIGTITIQPNTTYYARLTWNKLQYKTALSTDGVNYTEDMVLVGATRPYPRTIFIGGCDQVETGHTPHPFLGTINMNKAFLTVNGQVIWQGMDDAGLATRADISLSNLDEIGQAKFDEKVGFTDYASATTSGVIRSRDTYGTIVTGNGYIAGSSRTNEQYKNDITALIISKATLENIKEDYVTDVATRVVIRSW